MGRLHVLGEISGDRGILSFAFYGGDVGSGWCWDIQYSMNSAIYEKMVAEDDNFASTLVPKSKIAEFLDHHFSPSVSLPHLVRQEWEIWDLAPLWSQKLIYEKKWAVLKYNRHPSSSDAFLGPLFGEMRGTPPTKLPPPNFKRRCGSPHLPSVVMMTRRRGSVRYICRRRRCRSEKVPRHLSSILVKARHFGGRACDSQSRARPRPLWTTRGALEAMTRCRHNLTQPVPAVSSTKISITCSGTALLAIPRPLLFRMLLLLFGLEMGLTNELPFSDGFSYASCDLDSLFGHESASVNWDSGCSGESSWLPNQSMSLPSSSDHFATLPPELEVLLPTANPSLGGGSAAADSPALHFWGSDDLPASSSSSPTVDMAQYEISDSEAQTFLGWQWQKLSTRWVDEGVSLEVCHFPEAIKVSERTKVFYVTGLPSQFTIPRDATAFLINVTHIPNLDPETTVDALLKDQVDAYVLGIFFGCADPEARIACRRAKPRCCGAYSCEYLASEFIDVERRELDPNSNANGTTKDCRRKSSTTQASIIGTSERATSPSRKRSGSTSLESDAPPKRLKLGPLKGWGIERDGVNMSAVEYAQKHWSEFRDECPEMLTAILPDIDDQ
ncbi:hypothetical protein B0H13DRAFT_1909595 [Mycena leptocephala]|nr:hypothetical protein B0H13DRAFT_1909595 [Mycena leptocephala]